MRLTNSEKHIGDACMSGHCFDKFFADGLRLEKRNGKLCINAFNDNFDKVKSRSYTVIAAVVCWLPGFGWSHEKPEGALNKKRPLEKCKYLPFPLNEQYRPLALQLPGTTSEELLLLMSGTRRFRKLCSLDSLRDF